MSRAATHQTGTVGPMADCTQPAWVHISPSKESAVSTIGEVAQDEEGTRVGRYVLLRDEDGCMHALSASAVAALRECDEGCMLLLAGSRMLRVSHPLSRVLQWLAL